ncbi:MAG: HEPN domain-containing protein [Chloroflexota bacterium]|nr:HEPN domain-containing protein [Chloroflexota bacterium]
MVYVDPFDRRIERAETWIRRAKREPGDHDTQVIFHWIAFNALYGVEPLAPATDAPKATKQFETFFNNLLACDKDDAIAKAIWDELTDPVCRLMRNYFVFSTYWKYQSGRIRGWRKPFEDANSEFWSAWWKKDVHGVLNGLFERLYVLRNQLMHGGARWDGGKNRTQVENGSKVLSALVPVFVKIVQSCPGTDWGPLAFPPIDDPNSFDTEECSPPLYSP